MFSDRATTIVRSLQSVLHALDEHPSNAEREQIYSVLVSHIRSAQPMALLGGVADIVEPLARETIALGNGASVDLSVDDGVTVMYVVEASGKDVAVPVSPAKAGELRAVLARVR